MKFQLKCDCGRELEYDNTAGEPTHDQFDSVSNKIFLVDSWDELGVRFVMYSGTCPVCMKHWEIELSEELPQPAEVK